MGLFLPPRSQVQRWLIPSLTQTYYHAQVKSISLKLNHTARHLLWFLSFRRLVLGLTLSAFLLPCSCELEELIFKVAFRLRHIDVQVICSRQENRGLWPGEWEDGRDGQGASLAGAVRGLRS